jgi:hypothetical protein
MCWTGLTSQTGSLSVASDPAMLAAARVTHAVRSAIAATTFALTSSAALAQSSPAQVQEPARTAQRPVSEGSAQPSSNEPAEISLRNGRFTLGTAQTSILESWLSSVDMKCVGCGAFDSNAARPEPTSPNAPWLLEGKFRRQTPLGIFSAGFVGVRNYAMPPLTVTPIGGDVDPGLLGDWSRNFVGPTSQWMMTASFEKTLKTFKGGATVGVAADVMLPVKTESALGGDPRIIAMASRTIRAAVVLRW